MTLKLQSAYLKLNPDTVEDVRKEYNLNKPGVMDQAIDIIEEWIQKQEHFVKKDFSREYLERFIICSKGSVERAKSKIDKVCTFRTTAPNLFEKYHATKDFPNSRELFRNVVIPILCEDHSRVLIVKLVAKNITSSTCNDVMQYINIIFEYAKLHDYANGYFIIYDLNDINIMDIITSVNLVDFRNMVTLCMEAHGFRVKKICLVSSSDVVHTLVKIVKQFLSEKLSQRLCVLKNADSLQELISKKYLPEDYGGEQKSILDLSDEFRAELSSEKHLAHMIEMKSAATNEKFRSAEKFNTECLGMPGTFKMLSID